MSIENNFKPQIYEAAAKDEGAAEGENNSTGIGANDYARAASLVASNQPDQEVSSTFHQGTDAEGNPVVQITIQVDNPK